ncbi:MAG: hypothetical protein DCC68_07300 [Planctomycetota bacterium]|nr:MAG: hypothetical protein DCC68_07300 [Planctomycetota bacterium]
MNRLLRLSFAALVAGAAVLVVVDSASAQGCCKAGICKIPQIPSSATNNAMLDSMLNARDSAVAARPVSQNPASASAAATTEISLVNPANSQAKIEYILDGKAYALEPGMTLTMKAAAARKIEFSRDGNGTKAAYKVSRGVYEFAATAKGWELYRTQP